MKIEFNNLYTHFVFTTYKRERLISEKNRERIEKYITGIVSNSDCKLYAIYANPDHAHLLVSRSPHISEQKLAEIICTSSETFINSSNFISKGKFFWQRSASAFSVSKSDIERVCKYILNQAEHHKTTSFREEYDAFLKHYQKTLIVEKDKY